METFVRRGFRVPAYTGTVSILEQCHRQSGRILAVVVLGHHLRFLERDAVAVLYTWFGPFAQGWRNVALVALALPRRRATQRGDANTADG